MKISTKVLDRKLRALATVAKRDLAEESRKAMKGVIKTAIEITPPGGGGAKGTLAKRKGESGVRGDIRRVFRPVPKKLAKASAGQLAAIHAARRTGKGRRVPRGAARIPVYAADLKKYETQQKKKVGYLAAGFKRAGARLGYKAPAWIWRHSTPGGILIQITPRRIRIKATNAAPYAGDVKGYRQRIKSGIRIQERKVDRQLQFALRKSARKVGFTKK